MMDSTRNENQTPSGGAQELPTEAIPTVDNTTQILPAGNSPAATERLHSTSAATEVLPSSTTSDAETLASMVWSPPSTDEDTAVVDPLEAIRSGRPWPGEAVPSPEQPAKQDGAATGKDSVRSTGRDEKGSAVSSSIPREEAHTVPPRKTSTPTVWSAASMARDAGKSSGTGTAAAGGLRGSTLVWGMLLTAIGTMLFLLGFGIHIDLLGVTVVLLLIAGLGMLIVALAPKKDSTIKPRNTGESSSGRDSGQPTPPAGIPTAQGAKG